MTPLPFVDLVPTRGKGDCGICALAMLLGQSYEDTLLAFVSKAHPRPHCNGVGTREIVNAARRFGVKLTLKRTWDLDESVGLLCVERIKKTSDGFVQHLVLLKFGLLFDYDGTVWEPETYFAQHGFRPVSILLPGEDQ